MSLEERTQALAEIEGLLSSDMIQFLRKRQLERKGGESAGQSHDGSANAVTSEVKFQTPEGVF